MSARTDVRCTACGTVEEALVADAPWPCPVCGEPRKRVWGGGTFILRGGGWARRGFSLLELAITLVVISIISVLAMAGINAALDEFRSYEPAVPAELLEDGGGLDLTTPEVCGP